MTDILTGCRERTNFVEIFFFNLRLRSLSVLKPDKLKILLDPSRNRTSDYRLAGLKFSGLKLVFLVIANVQSGVL